MPAVAPVTIESGSQLSAAELSRLQRAALLIALLFVVAAIVFYALAVSAPNPSLAGLGGYFAWSGIVGVLHYLFLRVAARNRAGAEYIWTVEARSKRDGAVGRSDPLVRATPMLPGFAARWQWLILLIGLAFAFALFSGVASGRSPDRLPVLRVAAVVSLGSGCMLYFLLRFANTIQARLKTFALNGLLHLTHVAFWTSLAAAAMLFADVLTARSDSAWLGCPLIALPGLHVTWPWPFEQVEVIPTERARSISLGFYRDLPGPVLWRNIIVPMFVVWRVADPRKFREAIGGVDKASAKLDSLASSPKNTALGGYDFAQLVSTNPEELRLAEIDQKIAAMIAPQARDPFGVAIEQVGIERLTLPEVNTRYVFERMRAERSQFAARYRASARSPFRRSSCRARTNRNCTASTTDIHEQNHHKHCRSAAHRAFGAR